MNLFKGSSETFPGKKNVSENVSEDKNTFFSLEKAFSTYFSSH
jgi:hypothetical protein